MSDSSIFGVSVRAWLALITVTSGLAFMYAIGLKDDDPEQPVLLMVIGAVIGFVNLALGYYLGQKGSAPETTVQNADRVQTGGPTTVVAEPQPPTA
jgi:hypothetical protein